ncbi:hypothetical protein C9374_004213 [Naegleria lovaniensis]|uniref:Uncharacterized protein n=1 Tax=Naegleria lovaniensis TaxID=51637 RepID=A0AA88GSH5_NAELO|nr:uncharacterized protein C9374_004213 [Naegleria lovaniensis]KAG2383542.1 hypothetical protein C9374_004213 [Naegleria lovaniensis]
MNDIFNSFHLSPKDDSCSPASMMQQQQQLQGSPSRTSLLHTSNMNGSNNSGSKGSQLESYFRSNNGGAASTDISPYSSNDGTEDVHPLQNTDQLASFLEDDSNLDPTVQKTKADISTLDESLFSFVSNPDNFSEPKPQEHSLMYTLEPSPIMQPPSRLSSHKDSIQNNTEMIQSFITTCESLTQYLDGDSLGSIEDFFVGSCYDISKLDVDEMVKIFQDTYGTNSLESKRRFSNMVCTKIMPLVDEVVQSNEQFIEETIKKEVCFNIFFFLTRFQIQKDASGTNQKLLYLLMIFAALQSKSIKAHKKQIETIKNEEVATTARELADHAKKIKEFVCTIQTKDQIIEKVTKDNENLLTELNAGCQEIETLGRKVKNLKNCNKEVQQKLEQKQQEIENTRRDMFALKSELLESVEKLRLQYQSEIKQMSMMISLEGKTMENNVVEEYKNEVKRLELMLLKKEKQIESQIEREIDLKNTMREMHERYTEAVSKVNEISKPRDVLPQDQHIPSLNLTSELSEALREMRGIKDHFSSLFEKAVAVQQNTVDAQSIITKKELDELRRKLEMYQIELSLDPDGSKEEMKDLKSKLERIQAQKEMLCEEIKNLNQELATLRVISQERSFEKQRYETKISELVENQKGKIFRAANLLTENKRIRLSVDLAGAAGEHELLLQQNNKTISKVSQKDAKLDSPVTDSQRVRELEQLVQKLQEENDLLRKPVVKPSSQSPKRTSLDDANEQKRSDVPTISVEKEEERKDEVSYRVIPIVKRKPLQPSQMNNVVPQPTGVKITKKVPPVVEGKENNVVSSLR